MKPLRTTLLLAVAALAIACLSSCASARFAKMVPDGQHYLAKNKVVITNSKEVKASDLSKYISQSPAKSTGIGFSVLKAEPVIFDSTQVETSISSINQRLEYLGFYNSKSEAKTVYEGKKAKLILHRFPF